MTVYEILTTVSAGGAGVIVIILLGIIKIKPLEISVWSWLFRKIGKAFNGDLMDRINVMEKTLNEHIENNARNDALEKRKTILRFADEMYEGKYHSKEHFEEVLENITDYEAYCLAHPDFKNGRTEPASKIIKKQYEECLMKHSFEKGANNGDN